MDEVAPRADALLIDGERILAVGRLADVEAAVQRGARRVDLEGQTVIPGFNDCHCHVLGIGLGLSQIDVSADAVRTIGDIQRAVGARAAAVPEAQWIVGRGYDQNMLAERRHPTRAELDAAAPHHPVMLRHTSGHVVAGNSRALEAAGIGMRTADPAGGEIERGPDGEPTGLLKEAAMELLLAAIPPPTRQQGSTAIVRATEVMASYGITSATDAATGEGESAEPELAMYRGALSSGAQRVRILLLPQIRYVAAAGSAEVHVTEEFAVGDKPEWLGIEGTKIFSDGAMSTRTAAMRVPYAGHADNIGMLLWDEETLVDMMRRAHGAGWQIVTHALGDRAVETVLDCYQQAMDGRPAGERRHRMEHCMVFDEALGRRMRELEIVPVMQPDIFRLGDGYVAALGLDRACDVIPLRLLERLGVRYALSSDAPVVPCDPLANIHSAVERKTPSGVTLGRENGIDVMTAIRRYTVGGAYAMRTDGMKGMIRPGMLADFTVLSRDPASTPPEEWPSLRVTMTVVGGEVRYKP
jgi:predicted amidohydrolase YtcJ